MVEPQKLGCPNATALLCSIDSTAGTVEPHHLKTPAKYATDVGCRHSIWMGKALNRSDHLAKVDTGTHAVQCQRASTL